MMEAARKRRKWDVAAPGGMPLTGNRAGIGSGSGSKSGLTGFITAQGYQSTPPTAIPEPAAATAAVAPQPSSDIRPGQPIDQATIARAQQGAQAIVERINAELRAKGQLPPMRGHAKFHDDSKDIAREVAINDAPPPIRYNLTKRSVQDDIQRRTSTIVVIKGCYQAPGTPGDDTEGPLRLRIMPGNVGPDDMVKQRAVDAGASEVRRILQGGTMSRSAPAVSTIPPPDRVPGFVSAGGQPMQSPVQMPHSMPSQPGQILPQTGQQIPEMAQTVPLYVGVEAPPHFNLHQRLRGPGDSYLQHISSTSGASVTLRGRGSGMYDSPDHLQLFVSATNPKSFEDAKGLCVNLIDTVRAEHAKMFPAQLPGASQPVAMTQPQPHMPADAANGPGGRSTSHGPAAASYEQGAVSYPVSSQPPHSQSYAPHPAHPSSDVAASPHYAQASQYPPTSTYPAPSSYPPSMPSSMPPSSYPPSTAFRPQPGQGGPPSAGPEASTQSGSPHGQASPLQGQAGSYQGQAGVFPGQAGPQGQHGSGRPPQPGQPSAAHGHGMAVQPPLQQPGPVGQYVQYTQQGPYPRPQGPSPAPPGQYGSPGYEQQPSMHGQPQGMHTQQGPPYGGPAAHPQMRPEYNAQRPPISVQGRPAIPSPGQGLHGPSGPHQGMSNREMSQQAERKRRFTEQKKETQWQQGITQQPSMPSYGPSPPHPGGLMQQGPLPQRQGPPSAAEPEVPPLPMGPPPSRSPVQFKMGSMGPPPPRMIRAQGAQVQSHPPVQDLVPYGDDD